MKLLDKALCLTAFLGLAACAGNPYPGGEEIDNPGDNPGTGQEGLYLNVSATYIEVGETITLTVTNDGTDVTADAAIYERTNNYARLEPDADGRYTFSSDAVGRHEFFASYGNRNTDYITVSVVSSILEIPDDPNPDRYDGFTHRALAIQGTSLGCTYCPRVIAGIHDFVDSGDADKVVFTAAHGVFADPFVSDYSTQILTALGVSSIPQLYFNMTSEYNADANIPADVTRNITTLANQLTAQPASTAIAAATSAIESRGTVQVTAHVKVADTGRYRIAVWLIENNLYATGQENYYGSQLQDYDFTHHNYVVRWISNMNTVTGEALGGQEETQGGTTQVYSCEVSMDDFEYEDLTNLRAVVMVNKSTGGARYLTDNVISCGMNEQVAFEYED